MLHMSDFDEAYAQHPTLNKESKINCKPPACFVGSYAPVAKAGETGPFFVNTYLLQPNRKMEVAGTVSVRSKDLECKK
jgi:hypothetical protein|tara:strand:+ start:214 stop:447 length:234 start_codon:yes stop_codon:yes gene_type:complete